MGKKIVSQIVDSDDDIEKLKDELEVEKSKLTALALKEFEDQKAELLSKIKDVEKRQEVDELIQSGADLNRVKAMMSIIQSGLAYGLSQDEPIKKKPTGQAMLHEYPTNAQKQEWNSVEDMVNDIYDNLEKQLFLKEMGKPYSQAKLKKYTAMSNQLLSSMIKGFQNRDSTDIGKIVIMECPNCGKKIVGGASVCPRCGRKIMTGSSEGWR